MSGVASRNLPQEIILEIFTYLPAKSVGQFRVLSKTWLFLLSTSQFIESHRLRRTHEENLLLISPSGSLYAVTRLEANSVSKKLNFQPELPDFCTEVVGSCHGLVLVTNEENENFLVNPTIFQQVKVPNSPLALNPRGSFSMHGFGYDRISDDYKIVTLSYYDTDNEYEPDCADTFVDIYSVKLGVWRRLDSSPYDHAVPYLASGAFVNGAIHWLASSRTSGYASVIAAFDLADEKLYEIPAPNCLDKSKFVFNRLVALGGFLCTVDDHNRERIDIWIMTEYGLEESWTKYTVRDPDYVDLVKPLCFLNAKEMAMEIDGERLVVYNFEEENVRDAIVDGVPAMFIDGGAFVESLVSPLFNKSE